MALGILWTKDLSGKKDGVYSVGKDLAQTIYGLKNGYLIFNRLYPVNLSRKDALISLSLSKRERIGIFPSSRGRRIEGLEIFMVPPIFQYDLVDDLPAEDASPSPEIFLRTIKLFIDHRPFAAIAPHFSLLYEDLENV